MKKAKNKILNNLLTFDNKLFFKDAINIEEFKEINLTKSLKIEFCNILSTELKKFHYKKEIYIDLSLENILKVKEKFCVLYVIIDIIFIWIV